MYGSVLNVDGNAVVRKLYAHIKAFGTKLQLFEKTLITNRTIHSPVLNNIMESFTQDISTHKRGRQQPSRLVLWNLTDTVQICRNQKEAVACP